MRVMGKHGMQSFRNKHTLQGVDLVVADVQILKIQEVVERCHSRKSRRIMSDDLWYETVNEQVGSRRQRSYCLWYPR